MNWRTLIASGTLALAALALTGCGNRSSTFRYRLTVEVDTPQGVKTGSSVIEVDLTDTGDGAWVLPDARGINAELRGEAVAVDLPGGQALFALLRTEQDGDAAVWFAHRAVNAPPQFDGEYAGIRRTDYMKEHKLAGVLEGANRPMLVTFGDPADPTSVARVDPDDLAATFGNGVILRGITVQLTDDPVTSGIEERLGWLERAQGAIGKIPISERPPIGTPLPLHATLTDSSFKQGTNR